MPHRYRWSLLAVVTGLAVWVGHPGAQVASSVIVGTGGATFYGIGDLAGGGTNSIVQEATQVGSAVYAVGASTRTAANTPIPNLDTAVVWDSLSSALSPIPDLVTFATAPTNAGSVAYALSADVQSVAARVRSNALNFNFTTGIAVPRTSLNTPRTMAAFSALDISDNGAIVYGQQFVDNEPPNMSVNNSRAVRVDVSGPSNTRTQVPRLVTNNPTVGCFVAGTTPAAPPRTCSDSIPAFRGMSADGSVLVGTAYSSTFVGTPAAATNTYLTTNGLAYRWVFNEPTVTEIPRPAGGTWSSAIAVSPDGNLTLTGGNSSEYPLGEVWIHNATTNTTQELGSPNTQFNPRLYGGMTADGSVVGVTFTGGSSLQSVPFSNNPVQYAYLHNTHGWFHLANVLTAQGVDMWANGWDPANMILTGIRTVDTDNNGSPDLDLVFGQGRRRNVSGSAGAPEGFVASFPVGVLADYELPAAAPVANTSLVGAWALGSDPNNPLVVMVFLSDGTFYTTSSWYSLAPLGFPPSARFERGVYTLSAGNAFTLTTTEDRDGAGPPQSGTTPSTFVFNGLTSSLNGRLGLSVNFTSADTFTVEDATCSPVCNVFQGTRIAGGAGTIVGAWTIVNPPWGLIGRFIVVFLGQNAGFKYFEIGDGVQPAEDNSSDSGTYTFTPPCQLVMFEEGGGTEDNCLTLTRDELGVVAIIDDDGATATLTRVVNPSTVLPSITSPLTATGRTGIPFSYTITATYGLTFGAVGLPSALSIDANTGVISGIPVTAGDFPVTVSATNTFGATTTATLMLSVRTEQATLTVTAPASAVYNTSFSVSTSGGSGNGALTITTSGVCSNVGALVTMLSGTGACTITATKAGDGTFAETTSAPVAVAAAKATQATLIITNAPSVAANGNSFTVGHAGGSGTGAVTFSASGACSNNAGSALVTITADTGSCTIAATKEADDNFNTFVQPGVTVRATPAGQSFIGIGDLAGGNIASLVMDATKVNGSIYAVGASSKGSNTTGSNTDSPTLWTWNGVIGQLTPLPEQVVFPTHPTNSHWAYDITPNALFIGSRVRTNLANQNNSNAVRVERNGSNLTNFTLPGPAPVGFATAALSDNGSIAYAHAASNISSNNSIVRYSLLPNVTKSTVPLLSGFTQVIPTIGGSSGDGSVLVGTGVNALWTGSNGRAFRYNHTAGTTTEIPLLDGGTWSFPIAISPDGNLTLVAGNSHAAANGELYLHDAAAGTTRPLGSPNTAWGPRQFGGMTADGSVVAVTYTSGAWGTAAQEAIPVQSRNAYLRNEHGWFHLASAVAAQGVDLAAQSWVPNSMLVTGLSTADGVDLVFGQGQRRVNPTSGTTFQEGFVAEFPAGFLAGFNPQPTPPQGSAIVGGWVSEVFRTFNQTTELDVDVNVYMTDGTYVHVQATPQPVTNTAAAVGFERGLYTWQSDTERITATPRYDTNGAAGLGNFVGSPGLTFSPASGLLTGDVILPSTSVRISGSVPVGAWVRGNPAGADSLEMLIFRADGIYYHARDGNRDEAPTSLDGVETGTFAWDLQNHTLTRTATTVDGNGNWGLSGVAGPAAATISADGLQLVITAGAPGVYTRVIDPSTVVPVITSLLTATGVTGMPFSYPITATYSLTFGATLLPPGLEIDPDTGEIFGTPTDVGTFQVELTATNTFGATATATLTIVVKSAQSPLSVVAPANATFGTMFAATTLGGSGTGGVSFVAEGACSNLAGGGDITMTSGTGSCVITATKAGDDIYHPTTSPPFTVNAVKALQSALSVTGTPASGIYGQTFAVGSTGGTIAGAVTFATSGACANASGGSSITMTSALGACSITATMAGNADYEPVSSAPVSVSAAQATSATTLAATPLSSSPSAPVIFTATVGSQFGAAATGTVSFRRGGTTLGTADVVSGVAQLTLTSLGVGTHVVSAIYAGDPNVLGSTSSSVTVTVVAPSAATTTTLTSSLNPSVVGQTVTLTASVSSATAGTPTGTITFRQGTTVLATVPMSGAQATYSPSLLAQGSFGFTAVYSGDAQYITSTSATLTQQVNMASTTTTLTSTPNPSNGGQVVTFTATVSSGHPGTPTGSVIFRRGSTVLATVTMSGGQAVYDTSTLPTGSSGITAIYGGDTVYLTSTSATLTQQVTQGATTTVMTISPSPSTFGQTVTFTATVTSSTGVIPTGIVTFKKGGTTLGTGTLDPSGVATFTISTLSRGNHNGLRAQYGGDAYNGGSTSATLSHLVR